MGLINTAGSGTTNTTVKTADQLAAEAANGQGAAAAPPVTPVVPDLSDANGTTMSVPPPTANPGVAGAVTATPEFQSRTVSDKETVSGQLNDLLNEDSKYMQSAKANAMQTANSRGLINSSMAVGASQKAAIDSALPIAQGNAQTFGNAAQSAQEANQNAGLTGYKGLIDSSLSDQNIQGNKEINAENSAAALARQTQAEGAASNLATQRDAATADLQKYLQQAGATVDLAKLSSAEKTRLMESVGTLGQQKIDAITKINQIPKEQISDTQRATWINNITQQYQADVNLLASFQGTSITWDGTTPTGSTSTTPTGNTGGNVTVTPPPPVTVPPPPTDPSTLPWNYLPAGTQPTDAQRTAAGNAGYMWDGTTWTSMNGGGG